MVILAKMLRQADATSSLRVTSGKGTEFGTVSATSKSQYHPSILGSLTFQSKRDRDSAAQDHALRTGRHRGLVRRSPCGHNLFSYRRICSQVTPRAPRSVPVARLRHDFLPIACHYRTSRRLP